MPRESEFVTKEDCKEQVRSCQHAMLERSTRIESEVGVIKTAIVGKNLQGGLVKLVSDLKAGQDVNTLMIKDVKENNKVDRERALRWRLIAAGASSSLIVAIIVMGVQLILGL